MRVTRPVRATVLLVALMLPCLATSARADVGEKIILRCTANESLSGFSQSAYSKALKELSADTEEYSDCSSLIRQAQRAAAGQSGTPGAPGASGGGTPGPLAAIAASPAETSALSRAAHVNQGPVRLDGSTVRPGVIHANVSSAFSSMPAPLLACVAFLLAALLTLGGWTLRNRVRDGRAR